MAVRLYSEFSSSEGNRYKIEIHDSQWLAVATTFKVDGAGFQLTYDGETDDIISPIVSSKLTFGAYSENATFETFINTLKTFQENRFRVAVYIDSSALVVESFTERVQSDGGTVEAGGCLLDAVVELGGPDGYSLWWAGWITQDLVSIEDTSQPYIIQLTATDGLGKLANINYDVANDITQGQGLQLTRLTQMMLNALKLAGLYDLWGSSDAFLETSADWWETTAHTYSTATDPLHVTAVDVRLLQSFDSDGTLQYNNALEALRQIATLFAGRIYLQAGRWVFEQYGQRAASSRYVSRYTYGGTAISRTLVSDDVAVDQSTYSARKAGNNWDFLPAMRKAQVAYVQKFLNPFGFAGYRFFGTQSSGGFGGQFTAGFIAGGSGIQLGFGCAQFRFVLNGTITGAPVVPIFRVRIRIKDVSTGTFYYYRRDFVSTNSQTMFGTPQWTTTDSWYYFDLKAFFMLNSPSSVNQPIQIWTEDLPVSGDLDFRFEFYDVVNLTSNIPFNIAQAFFDGIFLFSTSTQGQNAPAGEIFTSVNNQAGIDSQLTLDLGEVFFAEGPLQTGHLSVYNGTEWVGSALWRKGSTGTGLRILKLLTSEALSLHVRPIERYNGEFIGSQSFGRRLLFESTAYLRTGGTFTARMDEWDGELYAIQRIRDEVTELDEVIDLQQLTPLSSSTTNGVSPNDFDAGRVAGMVVNEADQTIGPFQKVTTGGRVVGTLESTDVATFDRAAIVGMQDFVDAFSARVTADGGTLEAATCVSDAIKALSGTSFTSLTPATIESTLEVKEETVLRKATTIEETLDVVGRVATEYVQLDTAFVPNGEPTGAFYWDPDGGVPAVRGIDGISLDLNEKEIWYVKNQSGAVIDAGTAVYAAGTLGSSGQLLIGKMIADGSINAKLFLGITQATIDNGGDGYVVSKGKIRQINTTAWNEGDVLYVDENVAGALSDTEPQAPNLKLPAAFVVKSASNGTIAVRQTAGSYLAESHDVQISSPAEKELLARTASGRWENVELGSILTTTTEKPAAEGGESFTQAFGTNSGTIMGEPSKWLPITIGGVNYLMPLYLAP